MYNSIGIQGRLTADPEVQQTKSGVKVAKFSIANNQAKDVTYFFNCRAFDKTAETIDKYCTKGTEIIIDGYLKSEVYEKRTYITVIVNKFSFTSSSKKDKEDKPAKRKDDTDDYDDLPY